MILKKRTGPKRKQVQQPFGYNHWSEKVVILLIYPFVAPAISTRVGRVFATIEVLAVSVTYGSAHAL